MLERAVGLDPTYAPAWDALGLRYYYDALYSDGGKAAFDRSNAALERATTLDRDLISAAVNLSNNNVEQGELENSYAEAEELVKRRSDYGLTHFALAYVLRYGGLLKEAQQECDTALVLDPGNYEYRSCAKAFSLDGNFQLGWNGCKRFKLQTQMEVLLEISWELQKNTTVYKIDTIDVDGKPEVQFMRLKRMVGPRGRFSNFSANAKRL